MNKTTSFIQAAAMLGLIAAAASAPASAAETMSYADLMKVLAKAQGDPSRALPALKGRQIKLHLKSSGPQWLAVDAKDGVFFHCAVRASGFRGGPVVAKIVDYQVTAETSDLVHLNSCRR